MKRGEGRRLSLRARVLASPLMRKGGRHAASLGGLRQRHASGVREELRAWFDTPVGLERVADDAVDQTIGEER